VKCFKRSPSALSLRASPPSPGHPPEGAQWAYEIKHDGFRFIARRDGDRVRVFSRNAKDWTDKVPAIVEALLALPVASATIDGEGVVVDDRGVTDFERLRSALARRRARARSSLR
jgi:bifunctional non-homologous end joining protein LigD